VLDVVIVGAGGLGREVYEMFYEVYTKEQYNLKGFISDDLNVLDGFPIDIPLLGTIKEYKVKQNDRFILAIGAVEGRKKVAQNLLANGAEFISLIHPDAHVFKTAAIKNGTIVYPLAYIGANAVIDEFCIINAYTGCGHDTHVGAFSVLSPYSVLAGGTRIGQSCFMGIHAGVVPRKTIGDNVKITAGAIVTHNMKDDVLVSGIPAKKMRQIRKIN